MSLRDLAELLESLNRDCSPGCADCLRQRVSAIETALSEAEQRGAQRAQEAAFRAGYHCRWHKEQGAYCFDPAMSPGDPDGAYTAWLRERADQVSPPSAERKRLSVCPSCEGA